MEELLLMQDMTDSQRVLFQSEMAKVRKNPTTGVLLALFLGGFGAHHFYMGRIGLGILYTLFIWTLIPTIVAFVEVFLMANRVRRFNEEKALDLASKVKLLMKSATA